MSIEFHLDSLKKKVEIEIRVLLSMDNRTETQESRLEIYLEILEHIADSKEKLFKVKMEEMRNKK